MGKRRTAPLGGHVERCTDCGVIRVAYNSCRNRHCPKCQGLARAQWLADRHAELLPVSYFHLPTGSCAVQSGPRRRRFPLPFQAISVPSRFSWFHH